MAGFFLSLSSNVIFLEKPFLFTSLSFLSILPSKLPALHSPFKNVYWVHTMSGHCTCAGNIAGSRTHEVSALIWNILLFFVSILVLWLLWLLIPNL
jgi:hypothetical protein